MTDLSALQRKVEEATGADRELDCEIARVLLGYVKDPVRPDRWIDAAQEVSGNQSVMVRRWTDSLDAALSLVARLLPGWAWAAINDQRGCAAYVHNKESHFVGMAATPNPKKRWHECRAATPPLAVLAALLSALTQEPQS